MNAKDLKVGMVIRGQDRLLLDRKITAIGNTKYFYTAYGSQVEFPADLYHLDSWEPVPEDKYIVIFRDLEDLEDIWDVNGLSDRGISLQDAEQLLENLEANYTVQLVKLVKNEN